MALHIKDEETSAMVRELARKRGIGITAAIRQAVGEALSSDSQRTSLWERTADLRERFHARAPTGLEADKAFYDSLSDQDND